MLRSFLLVGIGGFMGSISRYGVSLMVNRYFSRPFPLATFLINIAGCFLIGLLFGLSQKYQPTQTDWWLISATGFCGGFTTFSSFALENNNLLSSNQGWVTLAYTLLSVILGIFLCRLGIVLVKS